MKAHEIRKNQRALGFWPYNFAFIPVETISAIYENFLEKEGKHEKRESGAYYTPRFLVEATLDLALEGLRSATGKRFLDLRGDQSPDEGGGIAGVPASCLGFSGGMPPKTHLARGRGTHEMARSPLNIM